MGTNCAPSVADVFLFCYESDSMISLSEDKQADKQADTIDAFTTTSRYLEDILNINNVYFYTMVSKVSYRAKIRNRCNQVPHMNQDRNRKVTNSQLDTVSQIYPSQLQLNKANYSDTEAAFLDLHLSISNDIVSTKIYDKRDDFDFEIVNFPSIDGKVPSSTSYGVYISQLIRFALHLAMLLPSTLEINC